MADVKVCIEDGGAFFYPDLLVSCHPQDLTALRFVQHPTVIVEVLSPATESYDRGAKFAQYRRRWELIPYGPEDDLELLSLEFSCPIKGLYEAVDL